METFADVIVPVPVGDSFTYRVPEALAPGLSVGCRVIVPFGKGRFYTGIVENVHNVQPAGVEAKEILWVPVGGAVVRHPQLRLWRWIADYYMCSVGDVMRAALPAGLKIESETMVEANPDVEADEVAEALGETELRAWQILQSRGKAIPAKLAAEAGAANAAELVNFLIEKGAAIISEKLAERFRPKTETRVAPAFDATDAEALREAFAQTHKSQRQEKLLQTLLAMTDAVHGGTDSVLKTDLLERTGLTSAVLDGLVKKGLARTFKQEVSRFANGEAGTGELPELSPAQNEALGKIHAAFTDKEVTLLHGVTSSGKTEIYIHLIDYILRQGQQVLYLVPEIALTTQLTRRLQHVFGKKVVIYHSRFSDNERAEIWRRLLCGNDPCVIIGARSSIFLPFSRLGLVVVDEEHESSFKQFDPAPRYNGRDCAIVLAKMHGAKALLGSATPSVETYYKTSSGKYGLVSLTERFAGMKLPEVEVVDMQKARAMRKASGPFADTTVAALRQTVRSGRQAILFHNRRGFAPIARCRQCAYIPKCQYCDVSLTYHKQIDRLVCHYCGATYPLPDKCPDCHEPAVEVLGYGTERVEDRLAQVMPDARVLRMDLDTTRNKNDYSRIIDAFSAHKADILVGTQMVTKGLDFDGVSAVVVLDADTVINYPDFRAAERAFNMLEQVAGRAGRKDIPGRVLVQTRDASNNVIRQVVAHDYEAFYNAELESRRKYCYPPFARIIYIYIKHRDARILADLAERYAQALRVQLGQRVFGPQEPGVAKVQNLFIRRIMLKVEPRASMSQLRQILYNVRVAQCRDSEMRRAYIYYDVDPY